MYFSKLELAESMKGQKSPESRSEEHSHVLPSIWSTDKIILSESSNGNDLDIHISLMRVQ